MPSPGTNVEVEITTQLLSADLARDWCVNTIHFNTTSTTVTNAQFQALSDAIKGVWFATSGAWFIYGTNGGSVKVYNLADPKPRPEKGYSTYTPGSWMTTVAWPRQTCLCVSFYSQRNLKSLRGRVYMPLNSGATPVGERPGLSLRTQMAGTIKQLYTVANGLTPSWQLSVHSQKLDQDAGISNIWCNDTWDIQRRRGLRETTRYMTTVP